MKDFYETRSQLMSLDDKVEKTSVTFFKNHLNIRVKKHFK